MYKMVIADDKKNERDIILFLIRKYKFELELFFVENGKEALELIKNINIDILLTDIEMPFLNGIELAKKIREIRPETEIIFFSGFDDFEYVKTALELRAVNYILKPINPGEFEKTIINLITSIDLKNHKQFYNIVKPNENQDEKNIESDSIALEQIAKAIKLRDLALLCDRTDYLINKYKNAINISHIYTRYLFTSMLELFFGFLANRSEHEFKQIVVNIYSMHRFSDVAQVIDQFRQYVIDEMCTYDKTPSHAVHLVKKYIDQHYGDMDLSLNLLANKVFLSPNYLSNLFLQVTGENLNKYIRNIRIDNAKIMLCETNMKVSDISISVGFSSVSYFCKVFGEYCGMTPEKFRYSSN